MYSLHEMFHICNNNTGVNRYNYAVIETEDGDYIECWTKTIDDKKTYLFKVVIDMYIKETFYEEDIQLGMQKAAIDIAKLRNNFNVKFEYKHGDMGHFA